jgi:predicted Zn finger-like uncharacterized protein
MYTRCPECETTFKVGVVDLRRAQGKVRCGDCDHVFNAVQYLTEDPRGSGDDIPVVRRDSPIITSADNPHRDEEELFPANETGQFDTEDGYELEIKAYDEKTGEAWSPLDTASWNKNVPPELNFEDETDPADRDQPDETDDTADDEDTNAEEELVIPDSALPDKDAGEDTLARGMPAWATDTMEEAASEQAFREATATDHGLKALPDIEPPAKEQVQAFDDDHGLEDYDDDAEETDAVVVVIGDDEAEQVWEADARDLLDEDDEAESSLDVSQTIEMRPAPDTEGLPTIEMPLSELTAGEPEAEDESDADEEVAAEDDAPTDRAVVLHAVEVEDADEHGDDDFDGTIWERIPGVGAAETAHGPEDEFDDDELLDDALSYQTLSDLEDADDDHIEPSLSDDNDIDAADSMIFDVPKDKWSTFFGTADKPRVFQKPAAKLAEAEDSGDAVATPHADDQSDDVEAAREMAAEMETVFGNTGIEGEPGDEEPDTTEDSDAEPEGAAPQRPGIPQDEVNEDYDEDWQDMDHVQSVVLETGVFTGGENDALEHRPDDAAAEEHAAADKPRSDKTWSNLNPDEEIVMETGLFGAAEIRSSRADQTNTKLGDPRTHEDENWNPEGWQGPTDETADPAAEAAKEWNRTYLKEGTNEDKPARKPLWLGLIFLLAIGFVTQLLHYNRDSLAANPAWGGTLRNIYANLGSELYPNWSVGSYEIRGSEAVSGESGENVLDIRTQIASVTDTEVGLPQLRVILRDRWSNPVAARNFAPQEYATDNGLPEDGMLRPNETVAAHVAIADPGSGAQGFELELCLPRRDTGLECTGQPFK